MAPVLGDTVHHGGEGRAAGSFTLAGSFIAAKESSWISSPHILMDQDGENRQEVELVATLRVWFVSFWV